MGRITSLSRSGSPCNWRREGVSCPGRGVGPLTLPELPRCVVSFHSHSHSHSHIPLSRPRRRTSSSSIADDLGLQVGCYGDPVAKTPHIDALAKSGTRFTHAFASVASCSPSRATILTGLPTHACGQYGLAHATHNQHSFRNVRGLPALLAPAGYRSGVIAKLHVQPKEVFPFDVEIPGNGRNPVQIAAEARKFVAECGDKPFFLLVGFTDPHRAAKGFANEGKYPA